jgi:xanthine dehydrogenase accessory factor
MIDDVFQAAIDILNDGGQAAMSTIISSKGSLPMSEKSKMLVTPEGKIIGTVGGGCLEADVWTEARRVMEDGKSHIQQFILTEKYAGESGLNCGGVVEILTEPLPEEGSDMFRAVLELKDKGRRGTLVTILTDHPNYPDGKRKILLCDDGSIVGSLGDSALEAFVTERGWDVLQGENFAVVDYQTEAGDTLQLFMEPILPAPTVYVFGGGHVSFFIVRAAKLAGFKVKVIDDRPAFANKERFPQADDTIVMELDEVRDAFDFGQDDYVVLVTRGHQHDQQILEQIYDCDARYLGMIGSKSKISKMWKRLEAKGIDASYLERVHAPIGLNIGADNPEEISISVVGELIMERRLGKVKHTRRKRSHDQRRDAAPASAAHG